jgi:hypothetical protein
VRKASIRDESLSMAAESPIDASLVCVRVGIKFGVASRADTAPAQHPPSLTFSSLSQASVMIDSALGYRGSISAALKVQGKSLGTFGGGTTYFLWWMAPPPSSLVVAVRTK